MLHRYKIQCRLLSQTRRLVGLIQKLCITLIKGSEQFKKGSGGSVMKEQGENWRSRKVSYTFAFNFEDIILRYINKERMQKIVYVCLALCLLQSAYSACADGTFTSTPAGPDAAKGECSTCLPVCVTCSSWSGCTTHIDKVKGVDRAVSPQTALCSGASATGAAVGYNKNNDSCDKCADGCADCALDYDICYTCKQGWDFDRNGFACLRATLGLSAVVLALSVLTLLVLVFTCICACKL